MEFDTNPVTHILDHLARDKSSERLAAFEVYNGGNDPYDNYLLLIAQYCTFVGIRSRAG